MATECVTPNKDSGYCVEIKSCPVLLEQLQNENAKKFLTASKCGPENEDSTNPKVCCGKYGHFRKSNHSNSVNMKRVSTVKIGNVFKKIDTNLNGNKTTISNSRWDSLQFFREKHFCE